MTPPTQAAREVTHGRTTGRGSRAENRPGRSLRGGPSVPNHARVQSGERLLVEPKRFVVEETGDHLLERLLVETHDAERNRRRLRLRKAVDACQDRGEG